MVLQHNRTAETSSVYSSLFIFHAPWKRARILLKRGKGCRTSGGCAEIISRWVSGIPDLSLRPRCRSPFPPWSRGRGCIADKIPDANPAA
jgi:hypothetical protein